MSIIDIPKKSTPAFMFIGDKLHPEVEDAIMKTIDILLGKFYINIVGVWLSGSMLTKQWNKKSDIDINVYYSDNLSEQQEEQLKAVTHKTNGRMLVNKHPINLYVSKDVVPISDSIYDIKNETWLKEKYKQWFEPKTIDKEKDSIEKLIYKINDLISATEIDIIEFEGLLDDIDSGVQIKYNDYAKNKAEQLSDELKQDYEQLKKTWKHWKNKRTQSLKKGGVTSAGNIQYKLMDKYDIFVDIKGLLKKIKALL